MASNSPVSTRCTCRCQRWLALDHAADVGIAVAGVERVGGTDFAVDPSTGVVTFLAGHIPAAGQSVTAGFEFDVPVRFDTDRMAVTIEQINLHQWSSIGIVEIRV